MTGSLMDGVDSVDVLFKAPFTCIVSGASGTGKSTLVFKIMENYKKLITPPPGNVMLAYGQYHSEIPKLEAMGVHVYPGLPSDEILGSFDGGLLLVIDDFLGKISEDYLSSLFTRKSHHMNISVFYLTQTLFDKKSKVARENASYIILTRSPSNYLAITTLGGRYFPGASAFFKDAYRQATAEKYGYLLVDNHPQGNPLLRLRTHILADEPTEVFINDHAL